MDSRAAAGVAVGVVGWCREHWDAPHRPALALASAEGLPGPCVSASTCLGFGVRGCVLGLGLC